MKIEDKRVYYAHSKIIYNTSREQKELIYLRKKYRNVICPNNDLGELGSIRPYLECVSKCDVVVCSEYKGYIGRGVCSEICKALSEGIPVKVLKSNFFGRLSMRKVVDISICNEQDWRVAYAKLCSE